MPKSYQWTQKDEKQTYLCVNWLPDYSLNRGLKAHIFDSLFLHLSLKRHFVVKRCNLAGLAPLMRRSWCCYRRRHNGTSLHFHSTPFDAHFKGACPCAHANLLSLLHTMMLKFEGKFWLRLKMKWKVFLFTHCAVLESATIKSFIWTAWQV